MGWRKEFPNEHLTHPAAFSTARSRHQHEGRTGQVTHHALLPPGKKGVPDFSGTPSLLRLGLVSGAQTAIAVVGVLHSLAPAEPFAQARAHSVSPGVRPPMSTRAAVERLSSSHGPVAAGAVCTE